MRRTFAKSAAPSCLPCRRSFSICSTCKPAPRSTSESRRAGLWRAEATPEVRAGGPSRAMRPERPRRNGSRLARLASRGQGAPASAVGRGLARQPGSDRRPRATRNPARGIVSAEAFNRLNGYAGGRPGDRRRELRTSTGVRGVARRRGHPDEGSCPLGLGPDRTAHRPRGRAARPRRPGRARRDRQRRSCRGHARATCRPRPSPLLNASSPRAATAPAFRHAPAGSPPRYALRTCQDMDSRTAAFRPRPGPVRPARPGTTRPAPGSSAIWFALAAVPVAACVLFVLRRGCIG